LEIAPEGGQGQAYGPGTTRVALAFGVTRLISTFLFGVKPTDPLTYAAVALGLAAIALLACYVPARRAPRVDPMVAVRCE
jgi:ABC-type lipoprotein release transport system permease subunit